MTASFSCAYACFIRQVVPFRSTTGKNFKFILKTRDMIGRSIQKILYNLPAGIYNIEFLGSDTPEPQLV